MTTLMLPVAGRSSRFPGMRPKWLLTMPSGLLMVEQSCQGLPLQEYDRIVLVCLREHLDTFVDEEILISSLKANIREDIEIVVLESPTNSHAETVFKGLRAAEIDGPFFLKDCDNFFTAVITSENQVFTIDLNSVDLVDAKNKSYIQTSDAGNVINIVEKQVISNQFCCGGYSFASSRRFCSAFEELVSDSHSGEIYISHIIYSLLLKGELFTTRSAHDYVDWGTLREYREFCDRHLTVFCDVDGVLLRNGSKFGPDGWASEPIVNNVKALVKLQQRGALYVVLTTSRPASEKEYVESRLLEHGLVVDRFIADLPHTKRILINDFAPTNPYPSALAINLDRNSGELSALLDYLG